MHYHDWEPFCVDPLKPELGQEITLRLRTPAQAGFLILERYGEVERRPMKAVPGGLEIRLPLHTSPLRYCFFLTEGKAYLAADGLQGPMPRYDKFFHLLAQPTVPDWAVGTVFYQIFPDRFCNGNPSNDPQTGEWVYMGQPIVRKEWDEPLSYGPGEGPIQHYGGDLEGILEKLDYLQSLGIETIYLNPVLPSRSNHRYDGLDYLNVDPHLGGNEAFNKLVEAMHQRGMKLVLDGVFNHIGNTHPDFQKALQDPTAPEAGQFTFYADGSYAAFYGVKTLPKLDYANPLTVERWIDGYHAPVRHWIRKGADGWRLDVAHQMGEGGTDRRNAEILRLIKHNSMEENPEAFVFGELFFDTLPTLRAHTLDGSMHYAGFANPVMEWLSGKNVYGWEVEVSTEQLWETLWDHYTALPLQLRQSMYTLISSHDIPRALWRLRGNVERFKLALGILFTFPGAPGLYYGDEIGLDQTNPYDDWNGDPMCRGTFPWNEQKWNQDVLDWTKRLIHLKQTIPALRRGGLQPLQVSGKLLSFKRIYAGEEVWVYVALEPTQVQLPPSENLLSRQSTAGWVTLQGLGIFRLMK
ncbi:glycoside hydrolase family 13 protein [Meiothermus sp.]|uniref:glycoside hydrolase family 13 protein n=1 Tax=Meiothermus sp. TaxID=1955249 RepID=UPI00307F9F64